MIDHAEEKVAMDVNVWCAPVLQTNTHVKMHDDCELVISHAVV